MLAAIMMLLQDEQPQPTPTPPTPPANAFVGTSWGGHNYGPPRSQFWAAPSRSEIAAESASEASFPSVVREVASLSAAGTTSAALSPHTRATSRLDTRIFAGAAFASQTVSVARLLDPSGRSAGNLPSRTDVLAAPSLEVARTTRAYSIPNMTAGALFSTGRSAAKFSAETGVSRAAIDERADALLATLRAEYNKL